MNLSSRGKVLDTKTLSIVPITREDLKVLEGPRAGVAVSKIRDSHHRVARLLALDLSQTEVARRTGYSYTRVNLLWQDPAFRDLVSKYRAKIDAKITEVEEEYVELLVGNRMKAERQISDKLDAADEADELLPTRDLLAISRDAADRTGFGKHSTQTNINVDWASKLERTIARSKRASNAKIVEGQVIPSPPLAAQPPQGEAQEVGSSHDAPTAPLIQRR